MWSLSVQFSFVKKVITCFPTKDQRYTQRKSSRAYIINSHPHLSMNLAPSPLTTQTSVRMMNINEYNPFAAMGEHPTICEFCAFCGYHT